MNVRKVDIGISQNLGATRAISRRPRHIVGR
jgi:hypothetical protein